MTLFISITIELIKQVMTKLLKKKKFWLVEDELQYLMDMMKDSQHERE
jgi:hypothetical protein